MTEATVKAIQEIQPIISNALSAQVNRAWIDKMGGARFFFDVLSGEVDEALLEFKKDLSNIFLEDELSDILWDFIMLITLLKEEGHIESVENVFKRAVVKYAERINAIVDIEDEKELLYKWRSIKQQQQQHLEQLRHDKKAH